MNDHFNTIADALAAGYVRARHGIKHEAYRHCTIISVDTSSGSEINYSFGMTARVPEHLTADRIFPQYAEKKFAPTRSVLLRLEKNLIHRPGSVTRMYRPDEFESGLQAAREWIDRYFDDHPDAAAAVEQIERNRAESDERHRLKQEARRLRAAT